MFREQKHKNQLLWIRFFRSFPFEDVLKYFLVLVLLQLKSRKQSMVLLNFASVQLLKLNY